MSICRSGPSPVTTPSTAGCPEPDSAYQRAPLCGSVAVLPRAPAGVADDGATVTVRLDAEVDLLAAAGPFAGMLPLSVPIQATGDSRTSLSR